MLFQNVRTFIQLTTILVFPLLLFACAAPEARYKQALNESEAGYSDQHLGGGRYQVNYVGNVNTPVEVVQDYALTRAAELTLSQNRDWFEIVDNKIVKQKISDSAQSEPTVVQVPNNYRCGLLGCTPARYSPTFSPASRALPIAREKYTAVLEVVMRTGTIPDKENAYDADTIINAREDYR